MEEGARLAILARDAGELDLARRELAALGGHRVLALPCDVRDRQECEWAVEATVERFGRLDVLVNNAGVEEFTWFAVTDGNPLASMNARRTARRIVEACRYGKPHLTLTVQTRLGVAAANLVPGLTARALELANRLRPDRTVRRPGRAGRTPPGGRRRSSPGWPTGRRWRTTSCSAGRGRGRTATAQPDRVSGGGGLTSSSPTLYFHSL